jgi:hypothetical protein
MPAPLKATPAAPAIGTEIDEFVEIGLLLHKNRASALLELARDRRETVGQLLRRLVDSALAAEGLSG